MIGADVVQRLFALRDVGPFQQLETAELLLIARHARSRSFQGGKILLHAGFVAEALYVVVSGGAIVEGTPAPAVFDAPGLLFGLPAGADYVAAPAGLEALVIAKPHVFTIARECPEFVVGLRDLTGGRPR